MYRALVLVFTFLAVLRGAHSVCKSDDGCDLCHICSADGICHQVPPFTDPNKHCGDALICGVRSVCGPLGHCVLEHKPSCKCHYGTGECLREKTENTEEKEGKGDGVTLVSDEFNQTSKLDATGEIMNVGSEVGIFVMCIFSIFIFCLMAYGIVSLNTRTYRASSVPSAQQDLERPFIRLQFFETRRGRQ